VQLALTHYQFEAIHPFTDGNGRIGRLLVSLFLCQRGILTKPLLYLSAFFERYRQEYYSRLLRVSQRGEWREWLEFFLRAVVEQCHDALARSHRLLDLHRSYYERSLERKLTPAARQLTELVFRVPVVNTRSVQASLGLTFAGARKAIEVLERENILEEVTGRKRNRAYAAGEVLRILEEDVPAR
ncbi:MAG: Fic family protein, partial [Dehalococcoidia bacterium]|nr:Fic family protein [Dehalococcoidia bacterium]